MQVIHSEFHLEHRMLGLAFYLSFVYECSNVSVYRCVWRPRVANRCLPPSLPTIFITTASLAEPRTWLANSSYSNGHLVLGIPCLGLSSTGMVNNHLGCLTFYEGLGESTLWSLRSSHQHLIHGAPPSPRTQNTPWHIKNALVNPTNASAHTLQSSITIAKHRC